VAQIDAARQALCARQQGAQDRLVAMQNEIGICQPGRRISKPRNNRCGALIATHGVNGNDDARGMSGRGAIRSAYHSTLARSAT
jgi:hypothetical protein